MENEIENKLGTVQKIINNLIEKKKYYFQF